MKANYLYKNCFGTHIKEVINEVTIKGYSIQKIKYSRYSKCNCERNHTCNCDTSIRDYVGYMIKETNDCYLSKEYTIERIKTLIKNKKHLEELKNKRIKRIRDGNLNYGERKKLNKGWTIEDIINKKQLF